LPVKVTPSRDWRRDRKKRQHSFVFRQACCSPTPSIRVADGDEARLLTIGWAVASRTVGLVCLAVVALACEGPTRSVAPSTGDVMASPSGGSTAPAFDQNRSPGLDGRSNSLAFSARIDSPADGDIYTIGVDGRGLRRLTSAPANEYSPSWSPDGSAIVFRSAPSADAAEQGPSDIAIVKVAELEVTFLTHDASLGNWSPAWSPTGEWIAYYSGGADRFGLYLIRPDGSDNHRILAGDAEYPAWSPDGRHLAFMSLGFPAGSSSDDYDIYVVNADGGNLQRLTTARGEDGWPAWSHDGTRFAFTRRTSEEGEDKIHVMTAEGADDRPISDTADGVSYGYPSWSPNDLYIAYSAYPQTASSSETGGMFVMRPDGTGRLLILADGVGPVWGPVP
jgi:Tol biopolymer transport system component